MVVKAEEEISACGGLWRKISLEDKGWNDTSVVWVEGHRYPLRRSDDDQVPSAGSGQRHISYFLPRMHLTTARRYSRWRISGRRFPQMSFPPMRRGAKSDTPTYDIMGKTRDRATTRGGIYIRDGKEIHRPLKTQPLQYQGTRMQNIRFPLPCGTPLQLQWNTATSGTWRSPALRSH